MTSRLTLSMELVSSRRTSMTTGITSRAVSSVGDLRRCVVLCCLAFTGVRAFIDEQPISTQLLTRSIPNTATGLSASTHNPKEGDRNAIRRRSRSNVGQVATSSMAGSRKRTSEIGRRGSIASRQTDAVKTPPHHRSSSEEDHVTRDQRQADPFQWQYSRGARFQTRNIRGLRRRDRAELRRRAGIGVHRLLPVDSTGKATMEYSSEGLIRDVTEDIWPVAEVMRLYGKLRNLISGFDDSSLVRLLLCVDGANSRLQVVEVNDDIIIEQMAVDSSRYRSIANARAWLPSSRHRKLVGGSYGLTRDERFHSSRESLTNQARRTGSGYLVWTPRQWWRLSSGVVMTNTSEERLSRSPLIKKMYNSSSPPICPRWMPIPAAIIRRIQRLSATNERRRPKPVKVTSTRESPDGIGFEDSRYVVNAIGGNTTGSRSRNINSESVIVEQGVRGFTGHLARDVVDQLQPTAPEAAVPAVEIQPMRPLNPPVEFLPASPIDGVKLIVDALGRITESREIVIAPAMSIFDVLYQAGLQRPPEADDNLQRNLTSALNTFDFDVAHSARAGCHVIFSISGLRADRTHRWLITVRDQTEKVVKFKNFVPTLAQMNDMVAKEVLEVCVQLSSHNIIGPIVHMF